MTLDLFGNVQRTDTRTIALGPGATLFKGLALAPPDLLRAVAEVQAAAPFRHMTTPGGFQMSAAMTNCGDYGWVTDRAGYRYANCDPETGLVWPSLPVPFANLAKSAAHRGGFANFVPDACLVNRYSVGAGMTLHQDKDERDFSHPIVSVSLGLPVVFLFGGLQRKDKPTRTLLEHGDVLVWGGPSRLFFHGVMPLKKGHDARTANTRINLTFRKAM